MNLGIWRNLLLSLVGDSEANRSWPSIEDVFDKRPEEINNNVYEIHRPQSEPTLEVVFFHGLELGDSHESYWKSWLCADEPHRANQVHCPVHCWLESWFSKDLPDARVLSVSYDSTLNQTHTAGRMDLYRIAENLESTLIDDAKVGQTGCPVILVGHSLGGLVMKALCIRAHEAHKSKLLQKKFLKKLKGFFFYATPHSGTMLSDSCKNSLSGPLMEDLGKLDSGLARLNDKFCTLLDDYRRSMEIRVIAESQIAGQITRLGKSYDLVVPEASSRFPGYKYYTADCDHFSICRPQSKTDTRYKMLWNFVSDVTKAASTVMTKNSQTDLQGRPVYGLDSPARSDEAKFKSELDASIAGSLAGLENPDSQAKSAEKLIYLSGLNDSTRHLFVSSEGALEKLACAMANIDDPYVQMKSATVISNLARGGAHTVMEIVSVKGILDALVAGLENHSSPELQGLISGIFLSLAKHNEEVKYKIVSTTGALEKLSCAMAENDNYDIQLQSAKSVAYLAMGGERITKKIVDSARLLNALQAGAGSKDIHSQELQQICIEALGYLQDLRMRLGK